MRRVAAVAAALVLGAGLLMTASPAQAATGTITGLAGKCVDVAAANSADGTAVQLYDCNGTGAQSWTRSSNGTLTALGKCLDVSAGSVAERCSQSSCGPATAAPRSSGPTRPAGIW